MFNKEEIERLKAENENYKNQLKLANINLEQLQKKYEHKHNEFIDLLSSTFLHFRKIVEIAERNDYGNPQQKIGKIKEYAETQKNYYAQLTTDMPIRIKNRTTTTDQSNR